MVSANNEIDRNSQKGSDLDHVFINCIHKTLNRAFLKLLKIFYGTEYELVVWSAT